MQKIYILLILILTIPFVSLAQTAEKAYSNRGIALYVIGAIEAAKQDFDKAIEINPNSAETYNSRGLAKYKLDDTTGACSDWSKAIELGFTKAEELKREYCK